jgi:hypothetical protein
LRQCPEPLPEGISRYGVIPRRSRQRTSHGIARRLPAAGEGFTVMSGCAHGVAPVQGTLDVPDKEFRYLRHFCYSDFPLFGFVVIRSFLPDSPYRYGDRTVPSRIGHGVRPACLACSL